MRKPGTNESDVRMSDVLCDFCTREWTEDLPMIEGHHGSCICGHCVSLAYAEVLLDKESTAPAGYKCPMCLEGSDDRAELSRADEPGWQSPVREEAVICRRCIRMAASALDRDRDLAWTKPKKPVSE